MTKKLVLNQSTISGANISNNWKANTKLELLNNSGVTPIRVDKMMMGVSYYHNHTSAQYVGVIIHTSDTNGNTFVDTIDGTSDATSDVQTLMEKWKDYIWMSDFRVAGFGDDGCDTSNVDLEAGTKRVLQPGQKMYVSLLVMAGSDTTGKVLSYLVDASLWYQQAAAA